MHWFTKSQPLSAPIVPGQSHVVAVPVKKQANPGKHPVFAIASHCAWGSEHSLTPLGPLMMQVVPETGQSEFESQYL